MATSSSVRVILISLVANLGIAAAKGVAAVLTGSGTLLAEAIHSAADCSNQVLLLLGARQARQEPDPSHPLGYGRAAYFWSFLVALMIFFGGGIFSLREGIHKILHPEPLATPWVGFVVLVVALGLEGTATWQCCRVVQQRRAQVPFWTYLRTTTDADLSVLFAEDSAAVVGLLFALMSLTLTVTTGDPHWDGYGSSAIGLLLMGVAVFLSREVKSLLEGERADPRIEAAFCEEVATDPRLGSVLRIITVQQGPGQVMIAAKLSVAEGLTARELIEIFNQLEVRVQTRCPDVRWQFLEPDNKD